MLCDNLTIIVQGKILKETLDFYIKNYASYKVIISTWNNCNENLNYLSDYENITVIQKDIPDNPGFQNINLQIESTLNGLDIVDTEYCIKIRGDEYFSNINYIFDQIILEPNKIHTSPIWFRHCSYIPYHMSDHLICSKTSNLKQMFKNAKDNNEYFAEVTLTKGFLRTIYPYSNLTSENCKEYMMNFFKILDLNKLKPYRMTTNLWNTVFYDNFIPEGGQSISRIEDI